MDWNTFFLIIAALLPAVILCIYVFKKDRAEKEPLPLLVQLFCLGAAACLPAAYAESFVIGGIDKLFSGVTFLENGVEMMEPGWLFLYKLFYFFIGVAVIEEGLKWIAMTLFTFRSHDYNSLFDGIIYAAMVSLGFAALENIFYVLQYGFGNAVMRAFLSVPGHMFFAVIMGYYYSWWHIREKARLWEAELMEKGLITKKKPFSVRKSRALSLLLPTVAHGIYNFCCSTDSVLYRIAFYVFIAFLYLHCFGRIRRMSRADAPSGAYARALLWRKYPEFAAKMKETTE